MVLEISATPYLFTFKMWDWGRLGLDGVPRPVHLDHARANVQWDRSTRDLGGGEPGAPHRRARHRTGLGGGTNRSARARVHRGPTALVHRTVHHDTAGTVNVLNLVEGAEAVVTSPTDAFEPFVVHYAETFVVPASVGPYTIAPYGTSVGQRLGTVKAYVRGTASASGVS